MPLQLVVVAYDVPDQRRRTRLFKLLKDFGMPVQKSVFECPLDTKAYKRMRSKVKRLVDPKEDAIRFYVLCQPCEGRVIAQGVAVQKIELAHFV